MSRKTEFSSPLEFVRDAYPAATLIESALCRNHGKWMDTFDLRVANKPAKQFRSVGVVVAWVRGRYRAEMHLLDDILDTKVWTACSTGFHLAVAKVIDKAARALRPLVK